MNECEIRRTCGYHYTCDLSHPYPIFPNDGTSLLRGVLEGMFVRGGLVSRNLGSSAILLLHG